jgi:hypothetical protein
VTYWVLPLLLPEMTLGQRQPHVRQSTGAALRVKRSMRGAVMYSSQIMRG